MKATKRQYKKTKCINFDTCGNVVANSTKNRSGYCISCRGKILASECNHRPKPVSGYDEWTLTRLIGIKNMIPRGRKRKTI